MKKFLFALPVALITFLCGIFNAGIFRSEQKPIPKPIFEKEIVDIPLIEVAPINEIENIKTVKNADEEGIYGWYSLNSYGKMSEIDMIVLAGDLSDENGKPLKKMKLSAGIYTRLSEDIDEGFAEDLWTTIDGNKVKFKTKKLKGIIYQFEGVFFKNKTSGENGEELLRGTLQKIVKGKKIAEVSGDFSYTEPYCLH